MRRRSLLALPWLVTPAFAQPSVPPRAIRVIVPFGAGGIIDVATRLLAEPMGAWAVVAAGSQASCRPRTRARHQCKGRSQAPGGGGANAELARMVVWAVS